MEHCVDVHHTEPNYLTILEVLMEMIYKYNDECDVDTDSVMEESNNPIEKIISYMRVVTTNGAVHTYLRHRIFKGLKPHLFDIITDLNIDNFICYDRLKPADLVHLMTMIPTFIHNIKHEIARHKKSHKTNICKPSNHVLCHSPSRARREYFRNIHQYDESTRFDSKIKYLTTFMRRLDDI